MGKQCKQWETIFLGSKITVDSDCSAEIKTLPPWKKAVTNLDSILKSRDITLPTKVRLVKATVFSSSHVQAWELDHKEGLMLKNGCFQTVVLRRLLRVPWTVWRSNQSDLKEINPEYSLEGLILKLKLQYFGYLMWEANLLEKTLMLEKIEGNGEGVGRGWDG